MTVGSQARTQLNMAQVMTKYGTDLTNMYNSATTTGKYKVPKLSGSTETLNNLLKSNKLKNKSEEFRTQFSDLYKSIFNIRDDDSEKDSGIVSSQSIKTASADAGSAAEGMKTFANTLKYNGEVDLDTYKANAQNFVDKYNAFIDKVGKSDNQSVLQKGVLMVNTAKVSSSTLKRAGITLGSDNKLTLQSDLSKVSAGDIKNAFGVQGFGDKVSYKARQINELTGGAGLFTTGGVILPSQTAPSTQVDNSEKLKTVTGDMHDAMAKLKEYMESLNEEDKDFSEMDYTDAAKGFMEKYNKFLEEATKSDKSGIRAAGSAANSITNSYKFALQRAGIEVGKDGKLSLAANAKVTEADAKYAFGSGSSYMEKIGQKADQVKSLASSAGSMGYTANSTQAYAYTTGSLFNVYA